MIKNQGIHRRIGYSLAGLRDGWKRERSFRTHLLASGALLLVMTALQPPFLWCALVVLALAFGLALELVNGAVEAVLDHLHPARHPQIRAAKDMASAAAFVANCAAGAVVVGMVAVAAGQH
jgi:diacylglycerol kinase (ATP)